MFHCSKQKGMHPLVAMMLAVLSAVGVLSLFCLCKKKLGCIGKKMKKVGCDCAESIEENFGSMSSEE